MNPVLPASFVRWAFYVYVISLPFEIPERTIPFEVHTVTGALLLLAALLQPRVCFRAPCAAFWWYVAYFFVYVVLGVYSTHTSEWIRDSLIFLQLLLLFWVTVNVMRPVTIARTALL